jgi:hypothetical protein
MPAAQLVHEFVVPFHCADVQRLDMGALRAAYAGMMDAAAQVGRCHGLEPDDYIAEHWADVRFAADTKERKPGHEGTKTRSLKRETAGDDSALGPARKVRTVRVEWLSERRRFADGLRRQCGDEAGAGPLALVALRLRMVREPAFDPFLRG